MSLPAPRASAPVASPDAPGIPVSVVEGLELITDYPDATQATTPSPHAGVGAIDPAGVAADVEDVDARIGLPPVPPSEPETTVSDIINAQPLDAFADGPPRFGGPAMEAWAFPAHHGRRRSFGSDLSGMAVPVTPPPGPSVNIDRRRPGTLGEVEAALGVPIADSARLAAMEARILALERMVDTLVADNSRLSIALASRRVDVVSLVNEQTRQLEARLDARLATLAVAPPAGSIGLSWGPSVSGVPSTVAASVVAPSASMQPLPPAEQVRRAITRRGPIIR